MKGAHRHHLVALTWGEKREDLIKHGPRKATDKPDPNGNRRQRRAARAVERKGRQCLSTTS